MAIIHINKESLVKKWREFYGEDFSKEYKGLSDSITDEVIIEKEGVIIFKGTEKQLVDFVDDSKNIADCILLDTKYGNISDHMTPGISVETYEEYGLKYGTDSNYDNDDNNLPDGLVRFKEWVCELQFGRYHGNDRIAIELVCHNNGEPIATATVNVPNIDLKENEIIIKDYSENKGILDALITAGIISSPQKHVKTGFVECPICLLLIEPSFK